MADGNDDTTASKPLGVMGLASGTGGSGGRKAPKTEEEYLEWIEEGLEFLMGEKETERRDYDLWLTLGPAERREFPAFTGNVTAELQKIKDRLKAEKEGSRSKVNRRGLRANIYMTSQFTNNPIMPKPVDAGMDDVNIEKLDDLMGPYFQKALDTKGVRNWDDSSRGIPHDWDTQNKTYNGKHPDAWLPGVFLTDEIFRALLWTVRGKIETAVEFGDDGPLNSFMNAINNGVFGDTDADMFLPFFNHHKHASGNLKLDHTYIKLVKEGDTIIGAIVQVGDWASGSHSNGSGIHYP